MAQQRIINQLVTIAIIAVVLCLSGCLQPKFILNQALIINDTPYRLYDIKILHQPTNRFTSINQLLPHNSYSFGFSAQQMLGHEATITWREGENSPINTVHLTLPKKAPLDFDSNHMTLIYTIDAIRNIDVALIPSTQIIK